MERTWQRSSVRGWTLRRASRWIGSAATCTGSTLPSTLSRSASGISLHLVTSFARFICSSFFQLFWPKYQTFIIQSLQKENVKIFPMFFVTASINYWLVELTKGRNSGFEEQTSFFSRLRVWRIQLLERSSSTRMSRSLEASPSIHDVPCCSGLTGDRWSYTHQTQILLEILRTF